MKKSLIVAIALLACLAAATTAAAVTGVTGELTAKSTPATIGAPADEISNAITTVSGNEAPRNVRMYGIGSVSKVFTAAAVMKLSDEGKLDIDVPVTVYIPEFSMADERYTQITARMLLNHSSGLMGMTDDNAFLCGDNDTYNHDNFLRFLKTQMLKHDPGDRSIYSNDSFTLAEILIEHVSGMSFTEYLEQAFAVPLGLQNLKTPQSEFDRELLAYTYLGNSELKVQSIGLIGSGGIYSTMEDLCRYATIFMDSSDGSVLSRASADEMARVQHKMEPELTGAETSFRYGLGWDCVEQYPFNQFGIRVLSKGGATNAYFTNLTVLPEHNLAAAVSSSGSGGLEILIAQQIILAVLEEEGLMPRGTELSIPQRNTHRAAVPESIRQLAGLYDSGMMGVWNVSFTDDSLILAPVGTRNERPMEFVYNTDGDFVSTGGDFLGLYMTMPDVRGVTALHFEGKYIVMRSYGSFAGLGLGAETMHFAEKIEPHFTSQEASDTWAARNGKEYLLVSEKYTSARYISLALAKTRTDERLPGYVSQGIYRAGGCSFPLTKIADGSNAYGYQNIPTMMGRDIVNLFVTTEKGVEYLYVNNHRFIDAATAIPIEALDETFVISSETVWVSIDTGRGVKVASIQTPENGSWFLYDDKMNCLATSLERNVRATVLLPEKGRLAFAGEPGAEFTVFHGLIGD